MSLLNPEETTRIEKAVKEAEKNTAGELLVAIIPESDNYANCEMVFGIVVGLIAYILLVIFTEPFAAIVDRWLWGNSIRLLPLTTMTITLAIGAVGYAAAQIPFLDRLIVGKERMAKAVKNRAMRHFVESASYDTIDNTGVLLFISILERRVELIADRGINSKVKKVEWDTIVNQLIQGIQNKHTSDAIEVAVGEIGRLLAKHVPPRPEDKNEIADGPTELQKGS